ncbi:ribosome 60S biogenesis N-terminal-domain-containing protein, partial [Naematelia encephala]
MKRKREELPSTGDSVHKPPPGTRSFTTGKAVKQALALGNRQSFVSFHQQILTASSLLPLPIAHSTIVILQHYLDASPTLDEIFECWSYADKSRNDKLLESAVALLIHIIVLLAPLPFFRPSLVGIVRKIQDDKAGYHIMLNKLVQSGKREQVLLGLHLAATVVQFDRPDPAAASHGASGRLAIRMWGVLVEGGSVKGLGKLMGMRRRGRDGVADYGDKDPLDKPDVRHALLQIILPLLSSPAFQVHARQILPGLYSNLSTDPPITVLRVLNAVWMAVTAPTPGVARRISLTLLDERALESLLGLLAREDIETSTGRAVGDIVGAFLQGVTCSPGRGLCFQDEGWYLRDSGAAENTSPHERERRGLHNRILANVIKKVGAKVADETRLGEWAINLFQACPELLAGYWAHSALSLEPRLAARWIATMSYIGRIISLPPPPHSTFRQPVPRGANISAEDMPPRSEPPSVATMIEAILPAPFTKAHITKGLSHPDLLVQHMTAVTLARGLQKLGVVQDALLRIERELEAEPGPSSNVWARRRRELEMEARKRVPEVLVIIGFAQRSATIARTLPDTDDEPDPAVLARSQMLTESALRLFGLYHQNLPSIANEARFDVGKLLVSASSARAERRERREAREGSVISDSGSVGSIGTVGTAGMGGGFGHARGEVHGFEALAQVH